MLYFSSIQVTYMHWRTIMVCIYTWNWAILATFENMILGNGALENFKIILTRCKHIVYFRIFCVYLLQELCRSCTFSHFLAWNRTFWKDFDFWDSYECSKVVWKIPCVHRYGFSTSNTYMSAHLAIQHLNYVIYQLLKVYISTWMHDNGIYLHLL